MGENIRKGENEMAEPSTVKTAGDDLLDELAAMNIDGDIPEEVQNLSPETSDDGKKKAGQAFARMRNTLKTAKDVILQQKEALKKASSPANTPPPGYEGGVGGLPMEAAANVLLTRLQMTAMQNIGIANTNHPLVQMEVHRLYSTEVGQMQQRRSAETDSKKVIDGVFSKFSQLLEKDKDVIRDRLSQFDVLDQVNPEVVFSEVHRFLGENLERFMAPSANNQTRKRGVTTGAGAAAASTVRSQGSSGVSLGEGAGVVAEEKPINDDERKRMAILGLDENDTDDIRQYRVAERKASKPS